MENERVHWGLMETIDKTLFEKYEPCGLFSFKFSQSLGCEQLDRVSAAVVKETSGFLKRFSAISIIITDGTKLKSA